MLALTSRVTPPPPYSRRSRLAAALIAVAIPFSAHAAPDASTRFSNNKSAAFLGDGCRKVAALAMAGPVDFAAPAAAPQLTALERMRMIQEGVEAPPIAAATPGPAEINGQSFAMIGPACPAGEAAFDNNAELGTVAIPVEHTSFDDSWDRVRRPAPGRLMRAELRKARVSRGIGEAELLERINLFVNHRLVYRSDNRNHDARDLWSSASETLARGSGDCEDFAILKLQLLRAAGLDEKRMKLVLLRDLILNADHALLLVRSDAGWVALDNMADRIYDGSRPNAVRPILSFSENRRWIHGYADPPPALTMAAISARSLEKSPKAYNIALADEPVLAKQAAASDNRFRANPIASAAASYRLALAGRR